MKNYTKILEKNKSIVNFTIFISIIIIDQLFKFLLIDKDITVIPNLLKFTYLENNGAAFGIFDTNIVLALNIIVVLALLVYWIKSEKNNIKNISIIVIIAGSIGNLIDRVIRGYVIDFIKIAEEIIRIIIFLFLYFYFKQINHKIRNYNFSYTFLEKQHCLYIIIYFQDQHLLT